MELKGIYFTIDSIIAGGIIVLVIVLASSFYIHEQSSAHLSFLSQDLTATLSELTVVQIDNGFINSLISDGTIKDFDNTVLEQIGEFWADNDLTNANRTASNVTENWVPATMGLGIWINNEAIYKRNMPIRKSLVSSKKIISGISKGQSSGPATRKNPPTLWGPATLEVRLWE